MFRIKPYTSRRRLEVLSKTLCPPGPRGPTETETDMPLSELVLACCRNWGSGCSRPGSCSITHHRATKQMTHKLQNDYTKEILALLRKF